MLDWVPRIPVENCFVKKSKVVIVGGGAAAAGFEIVAATV